MRLSDCFHNEAQASAFLERFCWPEGPVCPSCGHGDRARVLKGTTAPGTWKCYACRKPFSARKQTPFHNSHVPLHAALQAMYLLAATKGALSAGRISAVLGVSERTAWLLKRRMCEQSQRNAATTDAIEVLNYRESLSERAEWQSDIAEPPASRSRELRFERFRDAIAPADAAVADREFLALLHRFVGSPPPARKPAFESPTIGRHAMDEAQQFEFDLEWHNPAQPSMGQARSPDPTTQM